MPFKLRLVLMGCAGFVLGLLLARLPWWAAVVVLLAGATWAISQLISVERDLRRIRADLEYLQGLYEAEGDTGERRDT